MYDKTTAAWACTVQIATMTSGVQRELRSRSCSYITECLPESLHAIFRCKEFTLKSE